MSKPKHTVQLKNLGTPRRSHVSSATTPKAKIAKRNQIQNQVDEFLSAGGTIKRPDLENRIGKVKPRFNVNYDNPLSE